MDRIILHVQVSTMHTSTFTQVMSGVQQLLLQHWCYTLAEAIIVFLVPSGELLKDKKGNMTQTASILCPSTKVGHFS